MTHNLQTRFQSLLGQLPPIDIVTDVAFPLSGGLAGAAAAFAGDIEADIYARPHNPTVRILADTVGKLDQGVGSLAYSSGQAAIRNVLQFLTGQDTEVVVSRHIFGGTTAIESGLLTRFGVKFKWADATNAASFEEQVTDRTRAFFFEAAANPGGDIADFEGLKRVAEKYKIPVIVDNTTSPLLCSPAEYGANVIVYSATKYLNGQANATAGIVTDTGKFDWKDDKRFPVLSASLGAIPSLARRFNERALFKGLQSQLTVDGAILAPEKAAIIYNNLATLPERLQAHIDNTLAAAAFLNTFPAVKRVHYAGLADDPNHERSGLYLPHGVAGPILFTLKGGRAAAAHFIDNVQPEFQQAVNIGDADKNLVSHPATTTHRQLSEAQRQAIGIEDGSIRLSLSAKRQDRVLPALDRALSAVPS